MLANACNPCTWELEAEGLQVPGQPRETLSKIKGLSHIPPSPRRDHFNAQILQGCPG